MDDPTLEEDYVDEFIAETRAIRLWRSEQRAKFGMQWEDELAPELQAILDRRPAASSKAAS